MRQDKPEITTVNFKKIKKLYRQIYTKIKYA
jgi:hypothetical protein